MADLLKLTTEQRVIGATANTIANSTVVVVTNMNAAATILTVIPSGAVGNTSMTLPPSNIIILQKVANSGITSSQTTGVTASGCAFV